MTTAWMRRHWIPPWALGLGQLAHVLSWVMLLAIAAQRPFALGFAALGWLHVVVLGWFTLTALAVLVHVIPTFTDLSWRGEGVARAALVVYAAGVAALVTAFWIGSVGALPWAGTVVAVGLVAYLVPATTTLIAAFGGPRREAAIARALLITLTSLLVTALLGIALTLALGGRVSGTWLAYAAPIHGSFGIIGWLTPLIMGVSTRTVRPITGVGFRLPATHMAIGALELFGLLGIVAGLALPLPPVTWAGAIAVLGGALLYAGDVADVLRRATVTHRPPQAFVGAAAVWLVVGLVLAMDELIGAPWGAAAVYVLVIGWLGQMVNAHLHHIGVRLLATVVLGDDDETEPSALLTAPLSWTTFVLFQVAVAAGGAALVLGMPGLLAGAAGAGLASCCAMAGNFGHAAARANALASK